MFYNWDTREMAQVDKITLSLDDEICCFCLTNKYQQI